MNCFEFRQLRLSDPYSHNASADEHREDCTGCHSFEQEISTLEGDLHKALSVEVPEGFAAKILLNQSLKSVSRMPTRRFWLSMAASFLVVSFVGFQTLKNESYTSELTGPLLSHINHQPHEFYGAEHLPISTEKLRAVLGSFNAAGDIENVVYAAVCPVDGEMAAHLVIKDGDEQYTVMLIPERSPGRVFEVDTETWVGYISPHPAGALAVLADAHDKNAVARIAEMRDRYQSSFYLSAGL